MSQDNNEQRLQEELKKDAQNRTESRYLDEKDYILRKYLLNPKKEEDNKSRYMVHLKTILVAYYPDMFLIENDKLKINSAITNEKKNHILAAFGITEKDYNKNGLSNIDWKKFDFVKLDILYQEDTNPLWLILKEAIPLATKSQTTTAGNNNSIFSMSNNKVIYTAEEKIKNYVMLAEEFKKGSATYANQLVQKTTKYITNLFLQNKNSNQNTHIGIRTPGPDKAIINVFEMGLKAYDIISRHSNCDRSEFNKNFIPTQDWSNKDVKEIATVLALESNNTNLADWAIFQSIAYMNDTQVTQCLDKLPDEMKGYGLNDNANKNYGKKK